MRACLPVRHALRRRQLRPALIASHPLAAELQALRALFAEEAPAIQKRRVSTRALEVEIARAVHAAYGLTAADVALLWATAPPRLPFTPPGRT